MAMYSQRQFIKVFNQRIADPNNPNRFTNLQVLCFIWHNDTEDRWEIDYCDKVNKDTMKVNIAAVNHNERDACLMMLDEALTDANS